MFSTQEISGALIAAIVFTIANLVLQFKRDYNDSGKQPVPDVSKALLAALMTGHQMYCRQFGLDSQNIRFTIHARVGTQKYKQLCEYSDGTTGNVNRTLNIREGITGKAFRTGKVQSASRGGISEEEYKKALVSEWGMTDQVANERQADRQAWVAIPLPEIDKNGQIKSIEAVLYADTTESDFTFELEHINAAAAIMIGLTRYLGETDLKVFESLIDSSESTDNLKQIATQQPRIEERKKPSRKKMP